MSRPLSFLVVLAACSADPSAGRSGPPPATTTTASTGDTAVAPSVIEESFEQGPLQVDVLFVVDNSCSMSVFQDVLGLGAASLIQPLIDSGVDFHIGVTSTDTSTDPADLCFNDANTPPLDGRLQASFGAAWVDADDPSPIDLFQALVQLGERGSGCEMGLEAAYKALELRTQANAGFRRADADLHTVVVSDEDDQSEDWANVPVITQTEFIDWYALFPHASFHSMVCLSEGEAQAGGTGSCSQHNLGERYVAVTDASGGNKLSILEASSSITALSEAFVPTGRADYALAQPADEATLEVWLRSAGTEVDLTGQFTYDAATQTVTLTGILPSEGDEVLITYVPL